MRPMNEWRSYEKAGALLIGAAACVAAALLGDVPANGIVAAQVVLCVVGGLLVVAGAVTLLTDHVARSVSPRATRRSELRT